MSPTLLSVIISHNDQTKTKTNTQTETKTKTTTKPWTTIEPIILQLLEVAVRIHLFVWFSWTLVDPKYEILGKDLEDLEEVVLKV